MDGASCIETVPKRGYRFSGQARREERNGSSPTVEAAPTPRQAPRRWLGAVLAPSVCVLLIGTLWFRQNARLPVRSLLVLPFADLSAHHDNEYYSDGLTEELIAAFSTVRGLRVVPRTAAFQFKGKPGDVRAIASRVDADAVLDGGVQRNGDNLRVRLSLTRARDGETIWAQT